VPSARGRPGENRGGLHHVVEFPLGEPVHLASGDGTLRQEDLVEPAPASLEDVLQVHTEDYVHRLCSGKLSDKELRRLGLPWSESLVRRSFYAVGGTIRAAHAALTQGVGCNLAGGTHHSFADRGEGFCVLNDVAIAIRALSRDGLIRRSAIIDCDVHQGNGTATIFAGDPDVFTFSIHGSKNYPLFKAKSTLDVELEDGTGDEKYLSIAPCNRPCLRTLPVVGSNEISMPLSLIM